MRLWRTQAHENPFLMRRHRRLGVLSRSYSLDLTRSAV